MPSPAVSHTAPVSRAGVRQCQRQRNRAAAHRPAQQQCFAPVSRALPCKVLRGRAGQQRHHRPALRRRQDARRRHRRRHLEEVDVGRVQLGSRRSAVEAAVPTVDHSSRVRHIRVYKWQQRGLACSDYNHVSHDRPPGKARPLVEARRGFHRQQAVGPGYPGRGPHVPLSHVQHGHARPSRALQARFNCYFGARGRPHRCLERPDWAKTVSWHFP